MKRNIRTGTLLTVGSLLAALMGVAALANNIYHASVTMRQVGASLFQFAATHQRLPASIEEMLQAGYLTPAEGNSDGYFVSNPVTNERGSDVVHLSRYAIPWSTRAGDLIKRDNIMYWKDRPDERALLIRDTYPPLAIRTMGGQLAMALPVSLYDMTQDRQHR